MNKKLIIKTKNSATFYLVSHSLAGTCAEILLLFFRLPLISHKLSRLDI